MNANKIMCAAKPWRGFTYSNCTNAGKLEHDGKMWCGTHHPPTIATKQAAREAEYRKQEMLRSARRQETEAVERRRVIESLTDADLCAECERRGWEVVR